MTAHHTIAARDLYAAILREPACDLVRLAYADELDAAGECERAEFIRLQCQIAEIESRAEVKTGGLICLLKSREAELLDFGFDEIPAGVKLTYRRGFVDSVAMTMQAFVGGPCDECDGSGEYGGLLHIRKCYTCHGTGRTPGLASVICSRWPVTEIRLVDREPMFIPPDFYCWVGDLGRHHFPERIIVPRDLGPFCQRTFKSSEEAVTALSRDLVNYGRKAAGLPLMWLGDN